MFRPSSFAPKELNEGPTLPRYSLSSYASTVVPKEFNQSRMMVSRKYDFDRIASSEDTSVPTEPELPIYSGSFMLQQQFNQTPVDSSRPKRPFTSYSRKYAAVSNKAENTENKPTKIPIISYRNRYDFFSTSSTNYKNDAENQYSSLNVTHFHNNDKEYKIEPLIPVRRYQKEKSFFSANQNLSNNNFDIGKYGIANSTVNREMEKRIQDVQKWTKQTGIKRVYPDALNDDDLDDDESHAKRDKQVEELLNSSSSSSLFDSMPEMKKKKKPQNQGMQMFFQNGDNSKPIFSQFQSDVFAKYAQMKMNEMNNKGNNKGRNNKSAVDDFLFNVSATESNKKQNNSLIPDQQQQRLSEVKFNFAKNDQQNSNNFTFTNYSAQAKQNGQNAFPCKAKEDYERRKKLLDEELKLEFEKDHEATQPKKSEPFFDPKETEDIMAHLEMFKKQIEDSKQAQRNSNNFSDSEQPNSLLSESESADSSKNIQDDLLSEPSLIFEERPEIF